MRKKVTGHIANFAWRRLVAGFTEQPKYDPDNTHCAWCDKSQTAILNEHIEEHDKKDQPVARVRERDMKYTKLTYLIAGILLILWFAISFMFVQSIFSSIAKEGGIGGIIGQEVANYQKAVKKGLPNE